VKWISLAIWLAAMPVVINWLRRNPTQAPKAWMLLGLLPFWERPFHLLVAPMSWNWSGLVKGAELSVVDLLAICLLQVLPRTHQNFPFRMTFGFYFVAVLISVLPSEAPVASLFSLFQLARSYLLCAVVVKGCYADNRNTEALLKGIGIGLCIEATIAMVQHFAFGVSQAGGTLGHQNALAMVTHFINFPFLALMLSGANEGLAIAVPVAALMAVFATASRAAIGLEGAGFIMMFWISALRQWTPRKATVARVGVVLILIMTPLLVMRVESRRAGEHRGLSNFTNVDDRTQFEAAAGLMLKDHPFGVGPNMFVVVSLKGYFQQVGLGWSQYGSTVHNVYWLVAAESGYLGLVTFVIMLGQPMVAAFRCGWRNRNDRRGDLLLGFGVSLLMVYIHSLFEFELMMLEEQYIFFIAIGIIGGVAQQLGYWQGAGARFTNRVPSRTPLQARQPAVSTRTAVARNS
jgi:O-antigen ligase